MSRRLDITLHAVSVRRGDHWALREITLELGGGRWGLIGGNGAGKTQFLKLLAGEVWPTPTGRERREYHLDGRVLELAEAKTRIAYVGAERQDRYARYEWDLAVRDVIATGLHRTDLLLAPVTRGQSQRIHAVLRACGLRSLAARRFLSLSYGQKRLVLIARAVVQRPDWLLLDEIYNGLDTGHRRRLDRILAQLRRHGQAWIAAAHRAVDVPAGTTRLLRLDAGRLGAPLPLDAAALAALDRAAHPRRRRSVKTRAPAVRCGRTLLTIPHADLFVDYRPVLRDLHWTLREGEHWAVTGANGSGKSSFLKLLYGDLAPALGGSIMRRGFPPGTPIERWKRRTAYLSPELQTDYLVDGPDNLVASGRHASIGLAEPATAADLRVARRCLRFFGLLPLAQRRPRELSYGQMRRALMARALAANPRILLLDEPFTGLDPEQREAMKGLLDRLARDGVSLVMAVHHPEDLPRAITHVLHLHKRRAVAGVAHFTDGVGGTMQRFPA